MELVYVTVVGAGIAAVLRYLLPGRHSYGVILLPAIGAAVTATLWVGLTWLGWPADGGWIWVVSLGVSGLVAIASALLLRRNRVRHDDQKLRDLSGGLVAH